MAKYIYEKPFAEILFFDLDEVRMITRESKNDGEQIEDGLPKAEWM